MTNRFSKNEIKMMAQKMDIEPSDGFFFRMKERCEKHSEALACARESEKEVTMNKKLIALVSMVCVLIVLGVVIKSSGLLKHETEKTDSVDTADTLIATPTYIHVEGDRVVYDNTDDLMRNSDVFVLAKVKDVLSTHPTYDSDGRLTYIYTKYKLSVEKVLSGELKTDSIIVSQACGYDEKHGQNVLFSDMKPYTVGSKWLVFLYYDDSKETYWTTGDHTGRYTYKSEYDTYINNNDLEALLRELKK